MAGVLQCTDLVKSYNGVTVLKTVSITVPAGEVVGLIGENGAGKSTLSGIIAGNVTPDSGSMTLDGEPHAPRSPAEGLHKGVVLVHQEIRLGTEPVRGGDHLHRSAAHARWSVVIS